MQPFQARMTRSRSRSAMQRGKRSTIPEWYPSIPPHRERRPDRSSGRAWGSSAQHLNNTEVVPLVLPRFRGNQSQRNAQGQTTPRPHERVQFPDQGRLRKIVPRRARRRAGIRSPARCGWRPNPPPRGQERGRPAGDVRGHRLGQSAGRGGRVCALNYAEAPGPRLPKRPHPRFLRAAGLAMCSSTSGGRALRRGRG